MGVVAARIRPETYNHKPQLALGGPCWSGNMQTRDSYKPCFSKATQSRLRSLESPTASSVRWILIKHLLTNHLKWSARCHEPIHCFPVPNWLAIFLLPYKDNYSSKGVVKTSTGMGFLLIWLFTHQECTGMCYKTQTTKLAQPKIMLPSFSTLPVPDTALTLGEEDRIMGLQLLLLLTTLETGCWSECLPWEQAPSCWVHLCSGASLTPAWPVISPCVYMSSHHPRPCCLPFSSQEQSHSLCSFL